MMARLASLCVLLTLALGPSVLAAEPRSDEPLAPRLTGDWWPIAGQPDLGELTGEKQQPVDFAVWQAADGTWQLWSCIRGTKCGGKTRLFYGWEAKSLTDRDWTPVGIKMQADPNVGETAGGLQAPHVIRWNDRYVMFYGEWQHIALATSDDGKTFERRRNRAGTVGLFSEEPGANSRDAHALPVGDELYCYYTAYPKGKGAVYCRQSQGDLKEWSDSTIVAFGGKAGTNPFSAECPHVVRVGDFYYLFRTQKYGEKAQSLVYRSDDPLNFGLEDDSKLVGGLPIAAPELIEHEGKWYLAALNPGLDGIRMTRLEWAPADEQP
ncbi:MAG: hypothetical protein WBC44_05265 [Planctomycetaceae bacterium]